MSQLTSKRRILFISFPTLALILGLALLAQGTQAQSTPTATRDGFAHIDPVGSAPQNGGTVAPGTKFTLDLYINVGSNRAPNGGTAAQSYMTFNPSILGVIAPNGSCSSIPNNTTLAADTSPASVFKTVLQNEVCNGPSGCLMRGTPILPGNIAFASGALENCPQGCPDGEYPNANFKVASMTMCALAGGRAEIAFQFAPPAPSTRDSEIISANGDRIDNRDRYQSYIINVSGPTATPGPPTWTPGTAPTPPGGGQCAINFSDVPAGSAFHEHIQRLYCRDTNPRIITGFGDGTFRPDNTTKRAQLAKMIVLAFRVPLNTNGGPHFTDVPSTGATAEAYQYIETAYNVGIISGYANRLFKPWDPVKRGQVAKMVVKAAFSQVPTPPAGTQHFTDVPPTNEFYTYVEKALAENIITGFSDNTFRPYAAATRGQISKIIAGAMPE